MDDLRKSAEKPRGRPFAPGNSGKPKGTRHKTTMACQALLDGEAEKLTRKAIDLALGGDRMALRLCLERIVPHSKDRTISVDMPKLEKPQDAVAAVAMLVDAVGAAELTPSEASDMVRLVDIYSRTCMVADIEQRVIALEKGKKR